MSETVSDVQVSDKEDEIRARREARRRKILENAKSRLERLNGRINHDNQNGEVKNPKEVYPDPELETVEDIPFHQNNITNHRLGGFEQSEFNNFGAQQNNVFELLNNFSQIPRGNNSYGESLAQQHPAPKDTQLAKFLKTKVHLALISLFTYVLFCTGHEHIICFSVFLPLLIWELIEYFLLKRYQAPETSLFGIVLLISGMSPAHSNTMLKVLGTLNKIFKDVGVFVFFFVLCHVFATRIISRGEEFNKPAFTYNDEI